MGFSLLLNHPDRQEIVNKILSAQSPKQVYDWLRLKYPNADQQDLRLNLNLLKEFAKSNLLDYDTKINNDILLAQEEKIQQKKLSEALLNNKTYQDRINEIVDTKIDVKQKFMHLEMALHARMEQVFDAIQQDPSKVNKADYTLIKYMEQYLKLLESYNKSVNMAPDLIVQHNYTMEYIDNQSNILQQAVRETLEEMEPRFAFIFIEKMQEKLNNLEYKEEPKKISVEKIITSTEKMLNENINE